MNFNATLRKVFSRIMVSFNFSLSIISKYLISNYVCNSLNHFMTHAHFERVIAPVRYMYCIELYCFVLPPVNVAIWRFFIFTGTYTHLVAKFVFKRRLAYSFIQIYSPTFLIVVLSWLSFWISKDAVPARIALGITTVLTIVTLMGSLRNSVPKVR